MGSIGDGWGEFVVGTGGIRDCESIIGVCGGFGIEYESRGGSAREGVLDAGGGGAFVMLRGAGEDDLDTRSFP